MALMEANLLQVEFGNRGPTLWTVSNTVVPTIVGQATYSVPQNVITLLNVTIGTINADGSETELTITPMTRQEFTMQPVKSKQGRPTSWWFDRLIAPTITLWPVPNMVYNLHMWYFRQAQDAAVRGAGNWEVPYRGLDAICAGLSWRLARHYAPTLEGQRKTDFDLAYQYYANQDVEDGSVYFLPMVEGYYRN